LFRNTQPLARKIRIFLLVEFSRVGGGGADDPLARDRRPPIGMSEPDVPPGHQWREGGEDFAFLTIIWVSRPLPPAKWILGLFRFCLISTA
jgi:hypothetical protein